jgi:hypothetical protein
MDLSNGFEIRTSPSSVMKTPPSAVLMNIFSVVAPPDGKVFPDASWIALRAAAKCCFASNSFMNTLLNSQLQL